MIAEINITKEQWSSMNSAQKETFWYNNYSNYMTRREFRNEIARMFPAPAPVVEPTEKQIYLKSVYKFKRDYYNNLKVLYCGIYEEITGGILNNLHTCLKWKYPNTTKEETETILLTIQ